LILHSKCNWVILSACNTAAGGAKGAEALSGLARAFMYAGAKALLVSHWAVDSAATAQLITAAVGALTRDAKLGRAEACDRPCSPRSTTANSRTHGLMPHGTRAPQSHRDLR
jgi:hypothetical protein